MHFETFGEQFGMDDVLPLAAAAYNWFPNEHPKEPAFFLMFG